MHVQLVILGNNGAEPIKIDNAETTNNIRSVDIKVDTVPENVAQRSHDICFKVEIVGEINNVTNEQCHKLFEWSRMDGNADVYRTVKLSMTEADNDMQREYEIPNMFVEDYFEKYGITDDDKSSYTLKLIQKQGNMSKITTK